MLGPPLPSSSQRRIVVAGECLMDVITDPSGSVREVPGGGPYNTARTIARLGERVAFLGCVSRDRRGVALLDGLALDGVELSLVARSDAPTTIAHASLDEHGAASYRFEVEGTAAPALGAGTALAALDPGPVAIHVGTLGLVFEPSGTSLEALVAAAPAGTLVMLDPNARPSAIPDLASWRGRIRRMAARADVIRASTDDLAVLDPGREAMDVARDLSTTGATILVSDGPRAVRVLRPGADPIELPVPGGPVVDTVGAGDAFGGGFLAEWVRGRTSTDLHDRDRLVEAVRFGIAVAALTCGRQGADPPSRAEVAAHLLA